MPGAKLYRVLTEPLFMFVGTLSLFTNRHGGIIDDCIVTRTGTSSFFIVSNADRADVDLNHMQVCVTKNSLTLNI